MYQNDNDFNWNAMKFDKEQNHNWNCFIWYWNTVVAKIERWTTIRLFFCCCCCYFFIVDDNNTCWTVICRLSVTFFCIVWNQQSKTRKKREFIINVNSIEYANKITAFDTRNSQSNKLTNELKCDQKITIQSMHKISISKMSVLCVLYELLTFIEI